MRTRIVIRVAAAVFGCAVIAIPLLLKPYRVPSSSMEPTLHCAFGVSGCQAGRSDRILAAPLVYRLRDPRRGEIVVFKTPSVARERCGASGTFVKRLIGLPGETVEVRLINGDGYVFINGKRLDEPYIERARRPAPSPYGPNRIPSDHYFVLGDNRHASCDSREFGTIARSKLIAKVIATYWPPRRISLR